MLFIISLLIALIFNLKDVYTFLNQLYSQKLSTLQALLEEKGASGKTKDLLQEQINCIAFKYATGIKAERKLREEIINLHEKANGRLTYLDLRRAYRYLCLDKYGSLKIRKIQKLDWGVHWLSLVASKVILGFSFFFPAISLFYQDQVELANQVAILLLFLILFATAVFFQCKDSGHTKIAHSFT